MKGISPTQHNHLIKKVADLQQIFSYNHNPQTQNLKELSNDLQRLYAEHQALLEALAQNITSYNDRYSNLRKACRKTATIAGK